LSFGYYGCQREDGFHFSKEINEGSRESPNPIFDGEKIKGRTSLKGSKSGADDYIQPSLLVWKNCFFSDQCKSWEEQKKSDEVNRKQLLKVVTIYRRFHVCTTMSKVLIGPQRWEQKHLPQIKNELIRIVSMQILTSLVNRSPSPSKQRSGADDSLLHDARSMDCGIWAKSEAAQRRSEVPESSTVHGRHGVKLIVCEAAINTGSLQAQSKIIKKRLVQVYLRCRLISDLLLAGRGLDHCLFLIWG